MNSQGIEAQKVGRRIYTVIESLCFLTSDSWQSNLNTPFILIDRL